MRRNDGRRKSNRALKIDVSKSASTYKAKYRTIPSVSHSCIDISKNANIHPLTYLTRSSKHKNFIPTTNVTNIKTHNLRYGRRTHSSTILKTHNSQNRSKFTIKNVTSINVCNTKKGSILPVKNKTRDSQDGSSRFITDVTNAKTLDSKNGIVHPVTNTSYVKAPVFKYSKCRTCRIPCNDIFGDNLEIKAKYIIGSKALKLGSNFCLNTLNIDDRQETFVKNKLGSNKNVSKQLEPGDVYMDNKVHQPKDSNKHPKNGDFSCGTISKLDSIIQMKNSNNGLKLDDLSHKKGKDTNGIVQSSLIHTFKRTKSSKIGQNLASDKPKINIESKNSVGSEITRNVTINHMVNGKYTNETVDTDAAIKKQEKVSNDSSYLSDKTSNYSNGDKKKVSDSQEIIMVSINTSSNKRNDSFIINDIKTATVASKAMNHTDGNVNHVIANGKDIIDSKVLSHTLEVTDDNLKCENGEKTYNFDILVAIDGSGLNGCNGYLSSNNEENHKQVDPNIKEMVMIPDDCEMPLIVQNNSLKTPVKNGKEHNQNENISHSLCDDKNEIIIDITTPLNSTCSILKNIDPNLLDYANEQSIDVSKQGKNLNDENCIDDYKSCQCCVVVSDCSKYIVDFKRKHSPNHCREHNLIQNRKHVRLKEKKEKGLDFTSENDSIVDTMCVSETSRRLKFLHNRFYLPFVATNEAVIQKILENISLDIEMLEDNNLLNKCEWRECNRQFSSSAKLLDHLKSCHIYPSANNNTVFVCLWRKCKFSNQPSSYKWLLKHVLRHCCIKPFRCVILGCEMSFSTQSGLARHVPSHFNEGKVRRTCVLTGVDKTFSQEYGTRLENGEEVDDYDPIRKRTRHEMFVDRYKCRKIGDTGNQKGYNGIKCKVQLSTCNSLLTSGYTGNHFRFDHRVIGKRTSLDGSSDMLLSPSLTDMFPYKSFWFDGASLEEEKSMFVDISVSKLSEDIKKLLYDKERVPPKLKSKGKI